MAGTEGTTIVIPCYNEARRLDVAAFREALLQQPELSLLFVDDGSSDHTQQLLDALERQLPSKVHVLKLLENVGKAEAVRKGVLLALQREARFVGYWDADLSTPLGFIPGFRAQLEASGKTLVLGSRIPLLGHRVQRHWARHYLSRVFASYAALALGQQLYDTQCGAKLFRDCEQTRRVFAEPFATRWCFDLEILARLAREAARRAQLLSDLAMELPISEWRHAPESRVSPASLARIGVEALVTLAALRKLRRSVP